MCYKLSGTCPNCSVNYSRRHRKLSECVERLTEEKKQLCHADDFTSMYLNREYCPRCKVHGKEYSRIKASFANWTHWSAILGECKIKPKEQRQELESLTGKGLTLKQEMQEDYEWHKNDQKMSEYITRNEALSKEFKEKFVQYAKPLSLDGDAEEAMKDFKRDLGIE